MRTEGLRDRLVRQIDNLPEDRLREVLDFVAGICALEAPSGGLTSEPGIDPANDPVLKFIGGAQRGSLARDIDEELYGASM
jgi:hypothetical protein